MEQQLHLEFGLLEQNVAYVQKLAVLCCVCVCVEARNKNLTHGQKEAEEEMRELALSANGISATTSCSAVSEFCAGQQCGLHAKKKSLIEKEKLVGRYKRRKVNIFYE